MDELMERYTKLSRVTEFNPETFSQQWRDLADDFDKDNRHSMAAGCFGKAEWYAGNGYVQKLTYQETTRVQADYKVKKGERYLPCLNCDTWTKHVQTDDGYVCGCGGLIGVESVSTP